MQDTHTENNRKKLHEMYTHTNTLTHTEINNHVKQSECGCMSKPLSFVVFFIISKVFTFTHLFVFRFANHQTISHLKNISIFLFQTRLPK